MAGNVTQHLFERIAAMRCGSQSIVLGKVMTETAVKSTMLDRYRIVHFATHGLLAGETGQLAKNHAEPALRPGEVVKA